mmetsp:Transcript_4141/g.5101  ORF Transcript_4141/g.5101 Transcript_4141/m.5101 type:complete len:176 (-) Transcript_4141:86-613(-)
MIEARCDDDMVAAATEELGDSEEFEYFYDWLIRQYKEITQASQRMAPYFMRFVELRTREGEIVSKDSFVHYETGIWTHSVHEEGKGSSMRQKSGSCEHTVTQGCVPNSNQVKIQSRTKLESYEKSRFFVVTELAEKRNFRDSVELQEGVKANVSKQPINTVFKSKSWEYANQVEE